MRSPIAASVRPRATALVAAAVSVLLVAGCASGKQGPAKEETAKNGSIIVDLPRSALPPSIVRDEAIREQKQGSPTRALLEWWQALQFGDVEVSVRLMTPAAVRALGRRRFERLVRQVGPGLPGINVVSWRVFDNVCSIRVELLSFAPSKGDRKPSVKPTSSSPSSFVMRQGSQRRKWLFNDAAFLRQLAKNANI